LRVPVARPPGKFFAGGLVFNTLGPYIQPIDIAS
jgi:hypothetical protein